MKNKILLLALITFVAFSFPSCQKVYTCTCTANAPNGQLLTDSWTTPKLEKTVAQDDCTYDCFTRFPNTTYTNQKGTIVAK